MLKTMPPLLRYSARVVIMLCVDLRLSRPHSCDKTNIKQKCFILVLNYLKPNTHRLRRRDSTVELSWVALAACTEFTTSWRQSRRVRKNLLRAKSSCVVSAVWTHPSAVVTRDPVYNFLCRWAIEIGDKWRQIMTSLLKKLSVSIKIHGSQTAMESVWSVSRLSTEFVGSRRELVANCVHTADADATQLSSWLASAVCIISVVRTGFTGWTVVQALC